MRVHVWRDRDVALVEPTGDVDELTVELFRGALARAQRLATRHAVVVVLHPVRRFDAEALGEVVRAHARLRELGGCVALVGVGPSLRRVLTFTALDGVLPRFDSVEGALLALGWAPGDTRQYDR